MLVEFGKPGDIAALRWAWAQEQPGSGRSGRVESLDQPPPTFLAEVAGWLAAEVRTAWTAVEAGRAVGIVCLTEFRRMPSPEPQAAGSWGYLGHLYVRPRARGRGVGAQLVAAVLAAARERSYAKVVLSPTEASVPLYERCGFVPDCGLLLWRPPV